VIVYAGLIFLFSVSGSFKQLAILTSGALMLIYLSVVLSMIRLRMKKEVTTEKTFRVPGGYIIPIAAIASIIWFLSRLSTNELLSIVVFLVVFCVIYFAMKIQKSKKDITNE
jgi:L-asparagine transporter-like permease